MASTSQNAIETPASCWIAWVLKSQGCRFAPENKSDATSTQLAISVETGALAEFLQEATNTQSVASSHSTSGPEGNQNLQPNKYLWTVEETELSELRHSGLLDSKFGKSTARDLDENQCASPATNRRFDTSKWLQLLKRFLAANETSAQTAQVCNDNVSTAAVIQSVMAAYETTDVRIHMSGCHFELRPWLVSVETSHPVSEQQAGDSISPIVNLRFFDYAATELPKNRVIELALNRWSPDALTMQSHERSSFLDWSNKIPEHAPATLDRTIVWSKWAHGQISFETDQDEQHIEFSGWAYDFVEARLKPPGLTCRETGEKSHSVCATDDGLISNHKAFAECMVSGKRDLKSRLVKCDHCEAHASEEFTAKCPISEQRIIRDHFAICRGCQQPTSPSLIDRSPSDMCPACAAADEQIQFADTADAERFENVLAPEHRSRKWRIASKGARTVAVSSKWFQKFRIVEERGKIVGIFTKPSPLKGWRAIDSHLDETRPST